MQGGLVKSREVLKLYIVQLCRTVQAQQGGSVHSQDPASKDKGTLICLLNNSHQVFPR